MSEEEVYKEALRSVLQKEFRENLRSLMLEEFQEMFKEFTKLQELPLLLTRRQFMEFANISEAKCAQLFNRQDFPINREFGHPRVPTKLLFDWIYMNTDWIGANAPGLLDSSRSSRK